MAEEMHYPEDEEGIEVKGKPIDEAIRSGFPFWGTFPLTFDELKSTETGYYSWKII